VRIRNGFHDWRGLWRWDYRFHRFDNRFRLWRWSWFGGGGRRWLRTWRRLRSRFRSWLWSWVNDRRRFGRRCWSWIHDWCRLRRWSGRRRRGRCGSWIDDWSRFWFGNRIGAWIKRRLKKNHLAGTQNGCHLRQCGFRFGGERYRLELVTGGAQHRFNCSFHVGRIGPNFDRLTPLQEHIADGHLRRIATLADG